MQQTNIVTRQTILRILEGDKMIILDYMCDSCGYTEEKWQKFNYEKSYMCLECGKGKMKKVFLKPPIFKLVYDNKKDSCDWNGNTSRYWAEYKKQKAEGKKVRIPELDGESRTALPKKRVKNIERVPTSNKKNL